MESKKGQDTGNADDPIEITDDEEVEDTNETEDTGRAHPGPTYKDLTADGLLMRPYVAVLAKATPPAPSHLRGEDVKKWNYNQLLMATLKYLLHVYKEKGRKKWEFVWGFYQEFLTVNNTDYKDSPFMSFASSKALFDHKSQGKRRCERWADGLPETN